MGVCLFRIRRGPKIEGLEGVIVGLVSVEIGAFGGESLGLDSDGNGALEDDAVIFSFDILGDSDFC